MKSIRLLLKYFAPYRWSAIRNILYNILSALFALFSYTLVIPFLNIMFKRVEITPDPGKFQLTFDYLSYYFKYYLSFFIEKNGEMNTLLLVSIILIIASLFKNGFIFFANNSMAFMRASMVRDLRSKLYRKILRLSLSYFTEARKGDVMTMISNDVGN